MYQIPCSCGKVYAHWGDGEETGDEDEGAPRCLQEGDVGDSDSQVVGCRTHVSGTSPHQMGRDFGSHQAFS